MGRRCAGCDDRRRDGVRNCLNTSFCARLRLSPLSVHSLFYSLPLPPSPLQTEPPRACLSYATVGWTIMIYNREHICSSGTPRWGRGCCRCAGASLRLPGFCCGKLCCFVLVVGGGFVAAIATVHLLVKLRVADRRDRVVRYVLDQRDASQTHAAV